MRKGPLQLDENLAEVGEVVVNWTGQPLARSCPPDPIARCILRLQVQSRLPSLLLPPALLQQRASLLGLELNRSEELCGWETAIKFYRVPPGSRQDIGHHSVAASWPSRSSVSFLQHHGLAADIRSK